ncbi:hypothetical protein EIN_221980 [Entamoeba invadens IP1]|uniref:Uncharacterized protein n=1 Tax=Entamoeba invadens IP1 TaxID=370355 RepID=A0A0A1U5F5_ENTIV|nr:hypothetical protein EIN_221980 [Entamoeba invadens IP1]ELP88065.1 hypothetical protein EIN_221980 [Entamoeba invadens IP1]|eukprot:XP_004254836.1 hypothetical protein EIN_221980 [Entamoeba invadens IP1]
MMKGVHLIPVVKMPTDPKNLVLNEEGEKEWSEDEQRVLEERLLNEGNNITTILRLVGLLSGRTIQQITTRANWTLLGENEKIPFDEYKKRQERTEIQMVLPMTTKASDAKKKKPRQRHYSVIEGTQTQKFQKQRRGSTSRDPPKNLMSFRTGLSQNSSLHQDQSGSSLHESENMSPRIKSVSPNIGNAMDMTSVNSEQRTDGVDLNTIIASLRENEQLLQLLENSLNGNVPIQPDIFLALQNNWNVQLLFSQKLAVPSNMSLFQMDLLVTQQLAAIGMKPYIQSPLNLNWNFKM